MRTDDSLWQGLRAHIPFKVMVLQTIQQSPVLLEQPCLDCLFIPEVAGGLDSSATLYGSRSSQGISQLLIWLVGLTENETLGKVLHEMLVLS